MHVSKKKKNNFAEKYSTIASLCYIDFCHITIKRDSQYRHHILNI